MIDEAKRFKWLVSKTLLSISYFYPLSKTPVLLYHSVDPAASVISLHPAEFRFQMKYLKDHGYRTIPLTEYVHRMKAGLKQAEKAVVITFDDGFRNNYTEALPVLAQYGFTCTVFLATDYVGKESAWDKHRSIPDLPMLSWSQIREMREVGMEFGSHGCSHPHLTRLSEDEMRRELVESKSVMESEIGEPIRFFCHPYGEVTDKTQEMVKNTGYSAAFGSLKYSSRNTREDLYNLKRVGTAQFSNRDDFKAGISGTYDWYVNLKEYLGMKKF